MALSVCLLVKYFICSLPHLCLSVQVLAESRLGLFYGGYFGLVGVRTTMLPVWLQSVAGVPMGSIGLVLGMTQLGSVLSGPVFGMVADLVKNSRTLVISLTLVLPLYPPLTYPRDPRGALYPTAVEHDDMQAQYVHISQLEVVSRSASLLSEGGWCSCHFVKLTDDWAMWYDCSLHIWEDHRTLNVRTDVFVSHGLWSQDCRYFDFVLVK